MPAVKPKAPTAQTPAAIRSKYGDAQHFGAVVSPSAQASFARMPERAVGGNYPTLEEVRRAYGKDYDVEWLVPQLYDLSVFTGAKNLTEQQQEMLARTIAVEYPQLKVTELLLFFHRFKTGRYGRFYGSVDPITVMGAIETFLKEREELRQKNADSEADQWRRWAEERITPCIEAIRSAFGLDADRLYIGDMNGYQRKVRFSTDRQDVFDLLTSADAASRVKAIAQQYLDADTHIVIWYNMAGGDGVTI